MEQPLVSIIIPVYNVEQYLPCCIESVLAQTYRNLELILVDDGSPDGCGKICDAYAAQDNRIKVIHKQNGGLSDARNAGTDICRGKWVFYLDSDDCLTEDAIAVLMEAQQETGADLVIGNYYYTYSDHEEPAQPGSGAAEVLLRKEAISHLMQGKLQTFAWGKLVRVDTAKQLPFPVGKLFEDHFWTHYVFQACDKIAYISQPIVHYRQRNDSISFTFNMSRLDIIDGWRARAAFLQAEYPDLLEAYLARCAGDSVNLAWLVLTRMKADKGRAFQKLRLLNKALLLANYSCGNTKRLIQALDKGALNYGILACCLKAKDKLKL